MARRRKIKKGKVFKVIFILILVAGALYFLLDYLGYIGKDNIKKIKEPELKILDMNSKSRPYAVMIDNVAQARPHSGLDKSYLVYEIIVEGNLTRLMAVFRDRDVDEIGPVRSARPYFIDYALENDAIYVHHGRSPQAKAQLKKYDVDDLEGLYNPAGMFWRDRNRYAPHNSYTSTDGIKDGIKKEGYRDTSKKKDWLLLKYSAKEIDLSKIEGAISADKVVANFSSGIYASFEYNADKKRYYRFQNGNKHMDREGFQYSTKNIIVVMGIRNYTIDSRKGRQEIENVGTGKGYFISNGWALPITWEKESEDEQTVYRYNNGKEIVVNDGNTYIEIQPKGKDIEITPGEKVSTTETSQ